MVMIVFKNMEVYELQRDRSPFEWYFYDGISDALYNASSCMMN